jgi:uncharacterized protein
MGENAAPQEVVTAVAGAVSETERIEQLDTLRGVALLGILAMNIQSFSMVDSAYMNPTTFGDFGGANYAVWWICHLFADQKFMTLFSMLFGAGIVLQTSRQERTHGRSAAIHYRRMAVLLLFGLLHAYLLWHGDILTSYALCGMLVYLFRNRRPWLLVPLGILSLAVPSLLFWLVQRSMASWSPEAVAGFVRDFAPTANDINAEIEAFRGGWMAEFWQRLPASLELQTVFFAYLVVWRVTGNMLLGMALFKLGILTGRRSLSFYVTLIAVALLIGLPVILYGVKRIGDENWDTLYLIFTGDQFNYWGSILMALGWIGLVMLACMNPGYRPITHSLAAVGRMALTNYLMQTLICTTLFYGHGFGLYGQVSRVGQFGIVIAIWIAQLILSTLWLRYFLFGPAEWLWRTLTFLRLPPFRRTTSSPFSWLSLGAPHPGNVPPPGP